jgi:addiction module HigA family antidote
MAIEAVKNQYNPSSVSCPGETIKELLEDLGMSQAELAQRSGCLPKTISTAINGKSPITMDLAFRLSKVFGTTAEFWVNRDARYQEFLKQQSDEAKFAEEADWTRRFPITEMVERKWIPQVKAGTADCVKALLDFFGVASVEQWQLGYSGSKLAFRKADKFKTHGEALSAWVRQGERQANTAAYANCGPYNKATFLAQLPKIKALIPKGDDSAFAQLVSLCCTAGVKVVFVKPFKSMPVNGATMWQGSAPLILLSNRGKTHDKLWFNFSHEAGHIIKHGKKDVYISLEKADCTPKSPKEAAADSFAQEWLLSKAAYQAWVGEGDFSRGSVVAFAEQQQTHPGVVVGRLQHDQKIGYNVHLDLKVTLTWKE